MVRRKPFTPLVVVSVLLIAFVGVAIYFSGPAPIYCQQPFANREHRVVMFGTRTCPYCRQARVLFEENKVSYCEYDVNASGENQRAFLRLGGQGVPLILIGHEIFHGFDAVIILEELARQELVKSANRFPEDGG